MYRKRSIVLFSPSFQKPYRMDKLQRIKIGFFLGQNLRIYPRKFAYTKEDYGFIQIEHAEDLKST